MTGPGTTARIAFVQNGDFREAARRKAGGGGESYDAQFHSMAPVDRLAAEVELSAVICTDSAEPHAERLPSGVESVGLPPIWATARRSRDAYRPVLAELERLRPTHVIARLPSVEILRWCLDRDVKVLPCLADSFSPRPGLRGPLDRWRASRLARLLNDPRVTCVGNHNVAAAESLATIGVDPAKIVPWDWPRNPTPADFPSKTGPTGRPRRLICVGAVTEAKGVGDAIAALAGDAALRREAVLEVVGGGEIEAMRARAEALGVADRVSFAGRIPHAEVAPRMHAADAVLVYSRHAYGEGLPGTIYLGLASRTPLVVSDHPMFLHYLRDGIDVAVAPERDPPALAAAIRRLLDDPSLYARLSENAPAAFARICHPVLWVEFLERWLRDAPEDRTWLAENALPRWRRAA